MVSVGSEFFFLRKTSWAEIACVISKSENHSVVVENNSGWKRSDVIKYRFLRNVLNRIVQKMTMVQKSVVLVKHRDAL